LWIIVVLPWLCLTIVGETDIHVNNFWKWIWFVIFNRIRNNSIYSMTKRWCSSLIIGVSVDYSNFKIGWNKSTPTLSFICACKLHIQTVALWCYLAMAFKVCIRFFTSKHSQQIMYRSSWKPIHLLTKLICKWICVRWCSYGYLLYIKELGFFLC
jgi:hypothetical protein